MSKPNENSPFADLERLVHSEVVGPVGERPADGLEASPAPAGAILASLAAQDCEASAEEHLLHLLVAGEWNVSTALEEAKLRLAGRLLEIMGDARATAAVAVVLRDVIHASSSVSKRLEALLLASASLRLQRRAFRVPHQGGGDGV